MQRPIVGSVVVARQAKEDELIMAGVSGGACNAKLHGFNGSYYRTWNEARPLLADQRKKSKAVSCRPNEIIVLMLMKCLCHFSLAVCCMMNNICFLHVVVVFRRHAPRIYPAAVLRGCALVK
jgi:hypothetical protein